MNNLQSVSESLEQAFCNRNIHFAGIVEKTKSRNGLDIVDVLRKVTHERGFEPVVWNGSVLAFITIEELTFNSSRNGLGEATLVVISNQYGDHEEVIAHLDKYEFPELRLSLNSQDIYDRYFIEDENKPFQGFAFTITFQFSDRASLCCDSFTKVC